MAAHGSNDQDLRRELQERLPMLVPCRYCGLPLIDPKSKALGIGPVCAMKEAIDALDDAARHPAIVPITRRKGGG